MSPPLLIPDSGGGGGGRESALSSFLPSFRPEVLALKHESTILRHCWDVLKVSPVFLSGLWVLPLSRTVKCSNNGLKRRNSYASQQCLRILLSRLRASTCSDSFISCSFPPQSIHLKVRRAEGRQLKRSSQKEPPHAIVIIAKERERKERRMENKMSPQLHFAAALPSPSPDLSTNISLFRRAS